MRPGRTLPARSTPGRDPEVQAGRLADIPAPAADIVDQADGTETAVLQLRVLVDTPTTQP
jgi:hypothetical protein